MATKVLNLDRLKAKLRALAPATRSSIMAALEASGEQIVATQKSLAPVKTGALRDSIEMVPDPENLRVRIEAGGAATTREARHGSGAPYDYALGVEFGTRDTPAEPFFFPGFRANRKSAKSRVSRAVTKAAKRVAAGNGRA